MKKLLLALLLAILPAFAQNSQDPNERIQKIVPLKYVDANSVRSLLVNFGVDMQADSKLKVIALSGPRNRVTTAEDAIKQLDVPSAGSKDIDLTAFFLVGGDSPNLTGNPVPQELQSTVAALKSTFPFKNYVMLDALSLRTRSGVGAETSGMLNAMKVTVFRIRSANFEADNSMIRLEGLHAGVRNPIGGKDGGISYIDTGVTTDVVDVKVGQKLVVGRSAMGADGGERALFVVLIAKVAE